MQIAGLMSKDIATGAVAAKRGCQHTWCGSVPHEPSALPRMLQVMESQLDREAWLIPEWRLQWREGEVVRGARLGNVPTVHQKGKAISERQCCDGMQHMP